MASLTVVIPAYNEENGIKEIVERVLLVQKDLLKVGVSKFELLVVDDGSRDKTAEITKKIAEEHPELRLISHETNKGYGAALKTGFNCAEGDLVGFLDADGTYPPEYFPQLCEVALRDANLVIGSRMAGADSQMPMTRRVGNLFFANLLSIVGRQSVSDSASGMRVFKKDILEQIYPLPDGLNLTPVMSTRAVHEGIKMAEVPIPYSERVGRSKLSVTQDGTLFLQSMIWTALSYNPVRLLGMLGLIGIGLALMIALGLAVVRVQGDTTLEPWNVVALYIGAISGVAGISLFALGAMFNYLVSLFHKRPIRQGLFGKSLFKTPMEYHFGWFGLLALLIGFGIGLASLYLGLNGWDMDRLWLYGLGSAMSILVGVQLIIYWVIIQTLEELKQRDMLVASELLFEANTKPEATAWSTEIPTNLTVME
ncbi:MAG: glycosyltransferase family 2 protein [Candidatus Promineifilaceae bacterium]|jgi:glycosyltransferase involved in cell wall biosynthesis